MKISGYRNMKIITNVNEEPKWTLGHRTQQFVRGARDFETSLWTTFSRKVFIKI